MARRVFFSFHYKPDNWRASQVRNIGALEGNSPVSDNGWESITRGGDTAIQRWIDDEMSGRSCCVVLIGTNTAGRKWINYEIRKAWSDRRGLVGVHIHGLKDMDGNQSSKGANPFSGLTVGGVALGSVVQAHDTPYSSSQYVYDHIKEKLSQWVEEAIALRNQYS